MKASILAVGTELTSGQITNANATWISGKLKALGLVTTLHMTVPDDRDLIRLALKLCTEKSDLIFVTGGLGPTSDDFTRDLVTEWASQKLKFDEASWKKVQDRLTSRGFPVHDFQKQQCFFPEHSQILDNSQGTANAFYLSTHVVSTKHLWALPGPPREIEAVWIDHIQPHLRTLTQNLDVHVTRSWDVLGLGENQVAKLVEPLVKNSGLEVGYRVHLPYVEAKLSFFRSQQQHAKAFVHKVEEALAPYTIARDGADVAQIFCAKLGSTFNVHIEDAVTEGFLLKRLQPHLKPLLVRHGFCYSQKIQNLKTATEDFHWKLSCHAKDDWSCLFKMTKGQDLICELHLDAPFKSPLMAERRKQYFAEKLLIEAVKRM